METGETASERLSRLLLPLHTPARLTARRICKSSAEGDDLFHEAVLRALACIDQLRDEARFRAWFFAVLLSVHRARARRAFLRRLVPFWDVEEAKTEDGIPSPADGVELHTQPLDEETRTRAARITAALHKLPTAARQALVLFEVQGFSIGEIAELQGASESAVKSRLSRARDTLRQHYQAQCLDDGQEDDPMQRLRLTTEL
jgi:RNA polymerase sigma-70 factor (ECF subfamily)